MKIKQVLIEAAEMLGEKDAALFLGGQPVSDKDGAQSAAESLKKCYDYIAEELALQYVPLKHADNVDVCDGKIFTASLTKIPLKILSLIDAKGNKLPYKSINDYISVEYKGEISVEYEYLPEECNVEDDYPFYKKIGTYCAALGVACEFLLKKSVFSEAESMREKFENALKGRLKTRGSLTIKPRSWL